MSRPFKYLIYIVGLPLIGFTSMTIFKPLTAGAHDGGFLGMAFGLIIGQIFFTFWLLDLKWYECAPLALIIAIAATAGSFWFINTSWT